MILPKENERDLQDEPGDVRSELSFVPVETVEEVLKEPPGIGMPRIVVMNTGNSFVPVQNL